MTQEAANTYPSASTAVLLVDPYNDFLSEGGKYWPMAQKVAEEVRLLDHLRAVVAGARKAGIRIFFVPHRRWQLGDYEGFRHPTHTQLRTAKRQGFAKGTWGGTFHDDFQIQPGDILIKEHWNSSGFANTDLDYMLKQFAIERIVVIGMIANTCVECTGRFGTELGYHVTLVRDATAAYSREAMHAAHEINGPSFAHAILTTDELLAAFGRA
ncbi:cysteine hydrolase family protein [Reyranella sp.]|uniref:cysteine hydrolase family protein n=1 Tax=Reyranella sp. TaxID=1929291 RepID=UPI003BAC92DB